MEKESGGSRFLTKKKMIGEQCCLKISLRCIIHAHIYYEEEVMEVPIIKPVNMLKIKTEGTEDFTTIL